MKYDFTSFIERQGHDALAVDGLGSGFAPDAPEDGFDFIPMWVADMNFPVVPTITDTIKKRLEHPCFGYFSEREEYISSIIKWQETRNGVEGLTKECIGYENGVLGGVISALNALCSPGERILVHSPTYIGFTNSISNHGYKLIHSPLKLDDDNIWRMDYDDMEGKLARYKIHTAIMCSPHNPCGRVWEREELEKAMDLYKKYDVTVISDEIWSDIIMKGHKHIPTQSISEDARNRTIAFYAPSKTFSLAGLVGSYHIIYNHTLRDKHNKSASLSHYNNMNVLSMYGLIGAYKPEGYEWTDELCQVIGENIDYACDFIGRNFDGVNVSKPQGTYMLFLDCTKWCQAHGKSVEEVIKAGWNAGVGWQDGRPFHGECHIRMNLALPFSRVQEAFKRLQKYVFCK